MKKRNFSCLEDKFHKGESFILIHNIAYLLTQYILNIAILYQMLLYVLLIIAVIFS